MGEVVAVFASFFVIKIGRIQGFLFLPEVVIKAANIRTVVLKGIGTFPPLFELAKKLLLNLGSAFGGA